MLKYRGVEFFMDGKAYVMPSLSLRQFRDNYDALTADPANEKATDTFVRLVPIIGMAIRRNYPHVTDEDLLDWLDLDSLSLAIRALQSSNGMKVVEPGEATDLASTGAGSTAQ